MTTKTILADLTKKHVEAQKAAKASETELRAFLTPRLERLHSVGHSVLTSTYGSERANQLRLDEVDPEFHWLISYRMKIVSIDGDKATVNTSNYPRQSQEFKVDTKIIHLSDREYASRVRKSIKRKTDYREEIERKRATDAVNKLREELAEAEAKLNHLTK